MRAVTIFILFTFSVEIVFGDTLADEFDERVSEVHHQTANIGYQIAMSHGGRIVYEANLGFADLESRQPVDSETRFLIMSVTKAFTGAAVVKAVGAKTITPDDSASLYLDGKPYQHEKRVIRSFVTHTAGTPHRNHPERKVLYDQHFPNAVSALSALHKQRWRRPGKFRYSSGNYMILAALLESVHQTAFPDLIQQQLLDPLGLRHTEFLDTTDLPDNLARNYSLLDVWTYKPVDEPQRVPRFDYSFNMGGGGMIATATDLVRFGRVFEKPGFFTDSDLSLLHQPASNDGPWSYGWIVETDGNGRNRLSISGSAVGVLASLRVYPNEEISIGALSNCWCRDARDAEIIFGLPDELVARYLDALNTRPSSPLSRLMY